LSTCQGTREPCSAQSSVLPSKEVQVFKRIGADPLHYSPSPSIPFCLPFRPLKERAGRPEVLRQSFTLPYGKTLRTSNTLPPPQVTLSFTLTSPLDHRNLIVDQIPSITCLLPHRNSNVAFLFFLASLPQWVRGVGGVAGVAGGVRASPLMGASSLRFPWSEETSCHPPRTLVFSQLFSSRLPPIPIISMSPSS